MEMVLGFPEVNLYDNIGIGDILSAGQLIIISFFSIDSGEISSGEYLINDIKVNNHEK